VTATRARREVPAPPSAITIGEDPDRSGGEVDRAALDLALRRVRAYARRRVAWLRHVWDEEQAAPVLGLVTHVEIDSVLLDRDAPAREAAWRDADPEARRLEAEIAVLDDAREADATSRLARLRSTFQLDQREADLLDLLLTVELEPAMARVCAYLQDDATLRYPSASLAWRLFGHGRTLRGPGEALLRWGLVTEHPQRAGEPPALTLDPEIVSWLAGVEDAAEGGEDPPAPLPSWPVAETVEWVRAATSRGAPVRVAVAGMPGVGRRTFLRECAAHLGRPILVADSTGVPEAEWPTVARRIARRALLRGASVAWAGPLATSPPHLPPAGGDDAAPSVEWAIMESGAPAPGRSEGDRGVVEHHVSLALPSLAEREALWRDLVPRAAGWPAEALSSLAARFRVTPGEIATVARQAPSTPAEAERLVRAGARDQIGGLAEVVACPFTWDDLVVPDLARTQLGELQFAAEARPRLWERPEARRLFPGGRGLLALFSGPPGTGKTMASQVLAASLGVDLVRIDLSQIVSKYVGETSQNLDRVLQRAERLDVVLLFDEGDAIFGRRTEVKDAHDRYANTDTAYLLQAIEQYPGLAVLATNRKADIDPAFLRRFRFIVEFEKPGAAERARIWERVLRELAGEGAWGRLADGVAAVAASVEATGAQIKFAVLSALLLAEQDGEDLAFRHLIAGLARELQKDGRPFGEREQARLLRAAGP